MKKFILLFILLSLCGCSQTKNEDTANSSIVSNSQVSSSDVVVQVTPPENPLDFVRVRDYIPNIIVDLKYATKNNFTGEIIYNYDDAWLRYSTVCKLADAQEKLKEYGYQLCIWDAFRSAKSQQTL